MTNRLDGWWPTDNPLRPYDECSDSEKAARDKIAKRMREYIDGCFKQGEDDKG